MMNKSQQFIESFNDIDDYLRRTYSVTRDRGFRDVLRVGAAHNRVVHGFKDDLEKFSDLRNTIVHNNDVIADVSDKVARGIARIRQALIDPPRVEKFRCAVTTCRPDESLLNALVKVRDNNFSQFPVYQEKRFEGLLTENGITRWLARHADDDLLSTVDTKVSDILDCEESNENVKFIARTASVFDALMMFIQPLEEGRERVEAVLITENGRVHETAIGIITTWDIMNEPILQRHQV